jgi:cytochrome c6
MSLRVPQRICVFVAAVACVAFFSATASAQSAAQKLYDANKCTTCHGANGDGNTPTGKALKARDFHSPEVKAESDAVLTEEITNGKNKMPAYGKQLKPAEIAELVAYTRSLGSK